MLFRVTENIISNQHEVVRYLTRGYHEYLVKYIITKELTYRFLWFKTPIKIKNVVSTKNSGIRFTNQEEAEDYAKATYKCDEPEGYYDWHTIIHINGEDALASYGKFESYELDFHSSIYFKFKDKYRDLFGKELYLGKDFEFYKNPEKGIEAVKKHINKYDGTQIVAKFDVITMQSIPYENLKASSAELEELKNLLHQYKEDMDKYQAFLKKLLDK